MQVASSHNAQKWLESPLGEALLQQEARVIEEALRRLAKRIDEARKEGR